MEQGKGNLLFITGTDTGVGKTVVTALLCRALFNAGVKLRVMKPVETGCEKNSAGQYLPLDALLLKAAAKSGQSLDEIVPYVFSTPVAPAVAAEREKRPVDPVRLAAGIRQQAANCELLLWEGAGGLLVPIAPDFTYADLARATGSACLLVVGSRLGSINHAALTLEVLQARAIPLLGYVLNDLFASGEGADDPALCSNSRQRAVLFASFAAN